MRGELAQCASGSWRMSRIDPAASICCTAAMAARIEFSSPGAQLPTKPGRPFCTRETGPGSTGCGCVTIARLSWIRPDGHFGRPSPCPFAYSKHAAFGNCSLALLLPKQIFVGMPKPAAGHAQARRLADTSVTPCFSSPATTWVYAVPVSRWTNGAWCLCRAMLKHDNDSLALSFPAKVNHTPWRRGADRVAIARGEGPFALDRRLAVETGIHTGPRCKTVHRSRCLHREGRLVLRTKNKAMTPDQFELLGRIFAIMPSRANCSVQDLHAGADPAHR